jgi:hypothetical protein
MTKLHTIKHEFVEFVPEHLEPGIIYISVQYKTMAHLCCCGCGKKVVTPISPTGWQLAFNGRTVSIAPSVGNWNLDCRSHYVISDGRVQWAARWSKEMIAAGFARDQQAKQDFYGASEAPRRSEAVAGGGKEKAFGVRAKFKQWWSKKFGS